MVLVLANTAIREYKATFTLLLAIPDAAIITKSNIRIYVPRLRAGKRLNISLARISVPPRAAVIAQHYAQAGAIHNSAKYSCQQRVLH